MNYIFNCVILFNLNSDLAHVFNLEVHFNLFVWYTYACHVFHQVVNSALLLYKFVHMFCCIHSLLSRYRLQKVIFVIDLFVFYILLIIDLCLGVIGFINNGITDDIIVIKVVVILIIR